jgi:DNA-nicking Smr family endonuclease|tara:strand:+ start:62 stop:559 length:498 start_codon:yes stop_codon:yes gene_type:complete
LSPKIKLEINSKKSLEDLPNEKISISLNTKQSNKSKILNQSEILTNKKPTDKKISKKVILDQQLYKQFKNKPFQKIDLHGLTVDEAYQKVLSYLKTSFKKKNLLHIVITGLGNKSQGEEFFTGKIRKQFPQWLDTEPFQQIVKSYSPCKIKHGGLGAFYIKLRII